MPHAFPPPTQEREEEASGHVHSMEPRSAPVELALAAPEVVQEEEDPSAGSSELVLGELILLSTFQVESGGPTMM